MHEAGVSGRTKPDQEVKMKGGRCGGEGGGCRARRRRRMIGGVRRGIIITEVTVLLFGVIVMEWWQ